MNIIKIKNSGITLIALVITIIVMLILVAVTINMAVNGGLFGYAGNAASQTETARDDEKDWANVEANLTTEQLIAKYTTNKKEDLKKLRLYFTGSTEPNGPGVLESALWGEGTNFGDNSVITVASTIISEEGFYYEYKIIKYHDSYYKLYSEDTEGGLKYTNVEVFSKLDVTQIDFSQPLYVYKGWTCGIGKEEDLFELGLLEDYTITSNDTNVVAVDGHLLRGVAYGTTTITLTGIESGKTIQSIIVIVRDAPK